MNASPAPVARLNLELAQGLARSFPNGKEWRTVHARTFINDRGDHIFSDWSLMAELRAVGGVYAVLLPVTWFTSRTLPLHAPHTYAADCIPFEFTLSPLADGYGVIYVGRTTNLQRRIRLHLSEGKRKDGGQVKFGLLDCALHTDSMTALRALREHGRFIYTVLPNPENCANRDILEMALCARFGPPFNIKSER